MQFINYFIFIELYCSFCFYKKSPCQHKFIDINDNETFLKENISFENSKTQYEKFAKETIIVKEKIENELTKLKNLEDKILKEMTESFKKQHDNLTKIEKELKDDLINNVSKIKEELQKFINESLEIIKGNEKIGKYTQYFEKK